MAPWTEVIWDAAVRKVPACGGRPAVYDARPSVFMFSLFIHEADLTVPGVDMPAEQWQSAAGRRVLTPQEQAARERHFESKAAEAESHAE